MRYKEFNTNKVLENCISLFWQQGFGSCAINDIVKKTNVNRFSLYKEFENKEGILLAALNLYYERYSSKQIALLDQEKPLKKLLKEFYLSFLEDIETHPPGCFMIHISTELADHNQSIKSRLDAYLKQIEKALITTLQRHSISETKSDQLSIQLTGLFCNSMCFCLIQNSQERVSYIDMSLDLILNKITQNGTYA